MTIGSTQSLEQYQGNGSTVSFSFPYPFFAGSDLAVTLFDQNADADVSPAPVLNGSGSFDYQVQGTQDATTGQYLSGANVVFNTAPLGSYLVVIARATPMTQPFASADNQPFSSVGFNNALDRLTMLAQDLMTSASFALQAPETDVAPNMLLPPQPLRKNGLLAFDANANPYLYALTGSSVITPPALASTSEVFVSSYAGATNPLTAADSAAALLGWTLVVDTPCNAPSGNTVLSSASMRFAGAGAITLGNGNLTIAAPIAYARFADPYAQIFKQTGSGQVYFTTSGGIYSPVWFGANWQGSTTFANEKATTNAFLALALAAENAAGPWVCMPPPGTYVFAIGTNQTNNGTWLAPVITHLMRMIAQSPRTVRFDWDDTSIPLTSSSGYTLAALFAVGVASTRTTWAHANSSWIGGSGATFVFAGAKNPAQVERGFAWINVDIIHDPTPRNSSYLPANCGMIPLYRQFTVDCIVASSAFSGAPRDNFNLTVGGRCIIDNVDCVVSGFYGDNGVDGATTRNGATVAGWWDLLTPSLSANQIVVRHSRFKANADSGLAWGGCCANYIIDGCSSDANGGTAYEQILAGGEPVTQWQGGIGIPTGYCTYAAGLVFQATTGGTTSGSLPAAMSGATVGETGITDNTITWQCIGSMPANGLIPASFNLINCTDDGAIPATIDVPWLGTINTMTHIGGNGIQGEAHFVFHSANEPYWSVKNVVARNFGYSGAGSAVASMVANNGGTAVIDGYEQVDCYYSSTSNAALYIECGDQGSWGTAFFGTQTNNAARAFVRNSRLRNPTFGGVNTTGLMLRGNWNSIDISGCDFDQFAVAGYHIIIENAWSAVSSTESIRIRGGRFMGSQTAAITMTLNTAGTSSVANGIDIEDNEFYNVGIAGTLASPGNGCLIFGGGSGTFSKPTSLRFNRNKITFGGVAYYAVSSDGGSTQAATRVIAHGNVLGETFYWPQGSSYGGLIANGTWFDVDCGDNHWPRQRRSYGTATPTAGTWYAGDQQWRSNPAASGTVLDACTNSATLTGPMSGFAATFSNGSQTGTYTGTPPAAGEYVQFASGPTGTYQVVYAFLGAIGLNLAVNAAAAAVSLSYYTSATFKQLTLSS